MPRLAIYFALLPERRIAAEPGLLCQILERRQTGPLRFHAADNLASGRGWNSNSTYDGRRSFAQWAQTLRGLRVAAALEIPCASVGDAVGDSTGRPR